MNSPHGQALATGRNEQEGIMHDGGRIQLQMGCGEGYGMGGQYTAIRIMQSQESNGRKETRIRRTSGVEGDQKNKQNGGGAVILLSECGDGEGTTRSGRLRWLF